MSVQIKEGVSQNSGQPAKVAVKKHRWYLGGIASAMAACCTHPLDLLKVYTVRKQPVNCSYDLRRGRFTRNLGVVFVRFIITSLSLFEEEILRYLCFFCVPVL